LKRQREEVVTNLQGHPKLIAVRNHGRAKGRGPRFSPPYIAHADGLILPLKDLEFLHFFVRCLVKYVYHINFSLDRPTLIAYLLPESQL